MKKAISVTLNETIFQIEEDAYLKLDEYFKSIKEYYKPEEGGEIIFDIEASIAEKFSQKMDKEKKIITLKDVDEAIEVMGTVNEFEEELEEAPQKNKEEASSNNENDSKFKRLFRDPDDIIVGGVASGIAAYFEIDPLFVRIVFIALTIFGGSGIFIYLILWAIVPQAKNSAQKLEMRGKPVNLEEIQELAREKSKKIKEEGKHIIENVKSKKGVLYKILNFPIKLFGMMFILLKKIGAWFFPALSILIGIFFLIGFTVAILGLTVSIGFLLFNINSPYIISDLPLAEISSFFYYHIGLVSIYFVILIPLLFLITLGITMVRRKNSFHQISGIVLTTIWILAFASASVAIIDIAPRINTYVIKANEAEQMAREYNFKAFSKLDFSGTGLNVEVIQGDEFSIKATGSTLSLDRLALDYRDGELIVKKESIRARDKWCIFCWQQDAKLTIVMPSIDSIKGSQYVDVKISGFSNNLDIKLTDFSNLKAYDLKIDKINIFQNSYSSLYLSGQVNSLNADLSDYSEISGQDLIAKNAILKLSDYSDVLMGISDSLSAVAKNYSHVTYIGEPKLIEVSELNYSEISNQLDDEEINNISNEEWGNE